MNMFNKYKIIIAKSRVKEKIFLFWNMTETLTALAAFVFLYYLSKPFISDLYALAIGIGVAIVILMLNFDTDFGLSILDMIRLFIDDCRKSKVYYNFPNNINFNTEEVIQIEEEKEIEEFEVEYSKRRRKKQKN